eukprot:136388_1
MELTLFVASLLLTSIKSCSLMTPPLGQLYISQIQLLDSTFDFNLLLRIHRSAGNGIVSNTWCKLMDVDTGEFSEVVECDTYEAHVRPYSPYSSNYTADAVHINSLVDNCDGSTATVNLTRPNGNTLVIQDFPYNQSTCTLPEPISMYYSFTMNHYNGVPIYATFVAIESTVHVIVFNASDIDTYSLHPATITSEQFMGDMSMYVTFTDPSFLVTRLQVFEDVNVLMSPLPCCLSDSSSLSQYLITMPNDTSDTFVLDLTSVTWGSQIDVDTKIAISDGLGFATSFSVYHLDDDPVTATEYAPDLCDIGQTVNCLVAPCEVSSGCQMHPNAVCVNDYCGGCTAKWYDKMLVQTLDNDLMEDVTDSCDAGCICPAVFDPVYCEDGETYSNSCDAGCNGMTQCTKKMPIPPLVIDRKKVIEHKKKMRIQTFKHLRSRWRNVDKRSKHAAVAV